MTTATIHQLGEKRAPSLDPMIALTATDMEVTPGEGDRFDAPWDFKHAVQTVLRPGSIIIVAPQSLKAGSTGSALTVIDNGGEL